MKRRNISILALLTLGAAFAPASLGARPAAAADLAYHPAPTVYYVPPPSPCLQYEQSFREALRSIRATARLFRGQDRTFHRLKRRRLNDGFTGPDIALNAVMSAEQVDVSVKATQVMVSVAQARRLKCSSAGRLNEIDNEASRINHEIAEAQIWIDPRTFQ